MIVAIAGGIGSGKSVVSSVLRLLNYPVYDCDSNAKRLMRESSDLRSKLVERFGAGLYDNGNLNTRYLSSVAFSDDKALSDLNTVVHPVVKADMLCWAERCGGLVFVESAIPYSSGVSQLVDKLWRVTAPGEIRVKRVMARNGLSREQVEQRIAVQADEETPRDGEVTIFNDGISPLIPQIIENLKLLK